jgi:hypothetical protein
VRAPAARHALVRVEIRVELHVVDAQPARDRGLALDAGEHGHVPARDARPQRLSHVALPPAERAGSLMVGVKKRWLTVRSSTLTRRSPTRPSAAPNPVMLGS